MCHSDSAVKTQTREITTVREEKRERKDSSGRFRVINYFPLEKSVEQSAINTDKQLR